MANPNGNPQNLRPWQKGQSGNPGGKAKAPLSEALQRMLEAAPVDGGPTYAEQIADVIIKKMVAGDKEALRVLAVIFDRTEGKLTETVDVNATATIKVVPWDEAV